MVSEIPQFCVKADDAFAVQVIRRHLQLCWTNGQTERADQDTIILAEIIAWQQANPTLVQMPTLAHQLGVPEHVMDTAGWGDVRDSNEVRAEDELRVRRPSASLEWYEEPDAGGPL